VNHPRVVAPLRASLVLSAAVLALAACSSGAASSEGPSSVPSRPAATLPAETAPPEATPVTGEAPPELVEAVIDDVVRRTGADPATVEVVEAAEREWSDGSLGCPEPGMAYTQAIVDGYQVVVEVDGTRYDYRAASSGNFRLCEGQLGGASAAP
jgi:hypothetical protein